MIFIYLFIFFIFSISVIAFHESTLYDFEKFVYLVTDVLQFYRARSIYIAYDEAGEAFDMKRGLFLLLRQFSVRNIWSQGLTQSEFYEIYKRKISRSSRQLIVLILQNQNHLEKFENFTRSNNLSPHVWLTLFWSEPNSTLSYFCKKPTSTRLRLNFDIRMLVKCLDDRTIQEWYALSPHEKVIASDLFDWSPEKGIRRKTTKTLLERRGDFKGATIKVSNVQEHADLREKNGHGAKVQVVEGIMMEIIEQLNLSIKSYPSANFYGIYNESDGKWNGILGNLSREEIDISFAEFAMSPRRLESFDFTLPLFRMPNELYIKTPEKYMVKWNAYVKAFDNRIWVSMFIIVFIGTVTITFIKNNLKMSYWRKNNFFENYIYVWGIYCQQSLPEFPESSSLRIINVSLLLSAIVISAAYSGSIIRILTNFTQWLPFTSFQEFTSINTYKLIVAKSGISYDHFMYAKDPVLSKMAKMVKPHDELPLTVIDAFKVVCKENVAFYTNGLKKREIAKAIPCRISTIPEGRERHFAVALTKDSPLTPFLNYHIRRFDDYGLIKRWKNMYQEPNQYTIKKYDPVGFWEITPALMILIFGIVVSFLTLLFEGISCSLKHTRIIDRDMFHKNVLRTQLYKRRCKKRRVHFVE